MRQLSEFATRAAESRGRYIDRPESPQRSKFQRDRDRIIHSSAFRRLKGKTQVFVAHEGDDHRTRLTHSLEVAQIARSISRVLGLDEDLAEAMALAHDLGHPPFGHSGEKALAGGMESFGGFDHNAQTLRIVTKLEKRYPDFDGLNLTWEALEGIAKHNGPLTGNGIKFSDLPWAFRKFEHMQDLEPQTFAGPEAQVAALSDDIAYNNHDIDDGLRAGLFSLDDIAQVPMVGEIFSKIHSRFPGLDESRFIHEAVRELIGVMVNDLLDETRARLERSGAKSASYIRHLNEPVVAFSDSFRLHEAELRKFLFENMYRHYKVNRKMSKARRMVSELFDLLVNEPNLLPTSVRAQCDEPATNLTARTVCDYIAGMTDRHAIEEYANLLGEDRI